MSTNLLNRVEAAAMLTVSTTKFDQLRKTEGFPAPISLGGVLRWKAEDLQAWVGGQ